MPGSERAASVVVTLFIPIVSSSLVLLGFRRTVGWVRNSADLRRNTTPSESNVVNDCVIAVKRARYYTPWSGRCLARSLALWWALKRRGVDASLHLGVRRTAGTFEAHAWVAYEGRVLADSDSVWTEFPGHFPANDDLTFTWDR